MKKGLRWYDTYPVLKDALEKIKHEKKENQVQFFSQINNIIMEYDENLTEKHIEKFHFKRRWYDKNPYSWLVINSLAWAEKPLLEAVISSLKQSHKK
ncbi:MAG TPA: hypothetical protein DC049_01125 [Spirochaetia bacterium]|nr:hypothetical protein [Spirochaetia bacterium]